MRLSVSILCYNQLETTKKCIWALSKTDLSDTEFILTDNGSSDGTLQYLSDCDLPNKIVLHHGENLGFAKGHNIALGAASGTYFLALNNDMIIQANHWINTALKPFTDPVVALVGLAGTPCSLRPDGSGYTGPTRDYVEGSFLAGRTVEFLRYGLFSDAMKLCFEDSDISLRFRQMGRKLAYVTIPYNHLHAVTQRSIPRPVRESWVKESERVFRLRWSHYLQTREFKNKIHISIPSVGIGDLLKFTPVIESIALDHLGAAIEVSSKTPAVFNGLPFVFASIQENGKPPVAQYDRIVMVNPNYGDGQPLHVLGATAAGTVLRSCLPVISLTEKERHDARLLLLGSGNKPIVLVHYASTRTAWQGRNWSRRNAALLIQLIRKKFDNAFYIVEIGTDQQPTGEADLDLIGKTDLRQLFAVIAASDVMITTDSLPLHAAQAFKKLTYVMFGATQPTAILSTTENTVVIQNQRHGCLGCYHKKKQPGYNKCQRYDQACMATLQPEYVMSQIEIHGGLECLIKTRQCAV